MKITELIVESVLLQREEIPHETVQVSTREMSQMIKISEDREFNGMTIKFYFDSRPILQQQPKQCLALVSGEQLLAFLEEKRVSEWAGKKKDRIYPANYYSVSSLKFKKRETYSSTFGALADKDRVQQVDLVTTDPDFRRAKLGLNMYLYMVNLNYIICSDQYQTENGKGLWQSLMKISTENEGGNGRANFNNPGIYAAYLLTPYGFVTRDVNQDLKPIQKTATKKDPSGKNYIQTIPDEYIWKKDDADPNAARIHRAESPAMSGPKATLMFFGKTEVLNTYITNAKVPLINYSSMKTKYGTQHTAMSNQTFNEIKRTLINHPYLLRQISVITQPAYTKQLERYLTNINDDTDFSKTVWSGKIDNFIKVGAFDQAKMMNIINQSLTDITNKDQEDNQSQQTQQRVQ
jgi:hypothetical protein